MIFFFFSHSAVSKIIHFLRCKNNPKRKNFVHFSWKLMLDCLFEQVVAVANLLPADDAVDELDSYMYQTVSLACIWCSYILCLSIVVVLKSLAKSQSNLNAFGWCSCWKSKLYAIVYFCAFVYIQVFAKFVHYVRDWVFVICKIWLIILETLKSFVYVLNLIFISYSFRIFALMSLNKIYLLSVL